MKKYLKKTIRKILPPKIKTKVVNCLGQENQTIISTTKEYKVTVSGEGKLKHKIAVVTGGSGAIGRAICLRLSIEGAKVYIGGRNKENLNAVVSEIKDLGGKAELFVIDVTDARSISEAFESISSKENQIIDILVNCAGGGSRDKATFLYNQEIDVIDEVLNSNLRGSMLCSREAAKRMIVRKSGKIVNISSAVGIRGMKKYTEYAAAKAGIIGYTSSLALELAPFDINVNCVSPGFIPRGSMTMNEADALKKKCPMNKIGTLEDVAAIVAYLASDEAQFITGQNVMVDGGRTLGLYSES